MRTERAVGLAVLAAVVVGCSGSAVVSSSTRGTLSPMQFDVAGTPIPQIQWGMPGQLKVVQWGSSSCPAVVKTITSTDAHRLTIHTRTDCDGPGTADLAPVISTVAAPAKLDDRADAQARIDGVSVVLGHR